LPSLTARTSVAAEASATDIHATDSSGTSVTTFTAGTAGTAGTAVCEELDVGDSTG
jgi:hypothetical protein